MNSSKFSNARITTTTKTTTAITIIRNIDNNIVGGALNFLLNFSPMQTRLTLRPVDYSVDADMTLDHFRSLLDNDDFDEANISLSRVQQAINSIAYVRHLQHFSNNNNNNYIMILRGLSGDRHSRMMKKGRRFGDLVTILSSKILVLCPVFLLRLF